MTSAAYSCECLDGGHDIGDGVHCMCGGVMPRARSAACKHPKEKRSLLDGYEVVCECGEAVGRVALHRSDVVFNRAEAKRLLGFLGEGSEGSNERAKLAGAVGQ